MCPFHPTAGGSLRGQLWTVRTHPAEQGDVMLAWKIRYAESTIDCQPYLDGIVPENVDADVKYMCPWVWLDDVKQGELEACRHWKVDGRYWGDGTMWNLQKQVNLEDLEKFQTLFPIAQVGSRYAVDVAPGKVRMCGLVFISPVHSLGTSSVTTMPDHPIAMVLCEGERALRPQLLKDKTQAALSGVSEGVSIVRRPDL
ncbi:hypothetical protein WISP_82290 [Willisornis vidua]|uniref:Uncharacterized protein n=1 Tax=Willisornis vidua TaxID=1566151 RepID=A0ABQ9D9Y4_9PASS|nr:hypothetical protein WISP_82290 [Willisornis vidua]